MTSQAVAPCGCNLSELKRRLVDGEKWGYLYLLVLNIYLYIYVLYVYLFLIMECRSKGPCTVEIVHYKGR